MIFLAEEFNPPAGFVTWVACAAFLVFLGDRVVSLYRKLQPRPPVDEQLKHIEQKIVASKGELMDRMDSQDAKAEVRVTKLHERLNGHADRIGYVEGKLGIRSVQ